jgi:fucose permease
MHHVETTSNAVFRRDGPTWFLYLVLAVSGFQQAVLGSTLPFLRDEFHYDTVAVGWHFPCYAAGLVASGLLSGLLLKWLSVSALIRTSAVAMVVSVLSITQASSLAGTLAAAVAMGLTGGVVQAAVQAGIAWHQPAHRDVAMVEAFVCAGAGVLCGPLIVGQLAAAGIGWRLSLTVCAIALTLVLIVFRAPDGSGAASASSRSGHSHATRASGVPVAVALSWLMVVLGIGAEWGIGFWGAQFLESRLALAPAEAVSLMAFFFGGTVFGRLVSSRLLAVFDGRVMLFAVIFGGGAAILALWLSEQSIGTIAALTIAGMCLGNFFPLIVSNAIRLEPARVGLISVGATQAVGVALLVVPFALGFASREIGLVDAVGLLAVLPVLMACAYGVAASYGRLALRRT